MFLENLLLLLILLLLVSYFFPENIELFINSSQVNRYYSSKLSILLINSYSSLETFTHESN